MIQAPVELFREMAAKAAINAKARRVCEQSKTSNDLHHRATQAGLSNELTASCLYLFLYRMNFGAEEYNRFWSEKLAEENARTKATPDDLAQAAASLITEKLAEAIKSTQGLKAHVDAAKGNSDTRAKFRKAAYDSAVLNQRITDFINSWNA
jgi:hypothetical protein